MEPSFGIWRLCRHIVGKDDVRPPVTIQIPYRHPVWIRSRSEIHPRCKRTARETARRADVLEQGKLARTMRHRRHVRLPSPSKSPIATVLPQPPSPKSICAERMSDVARRARVPIHRHRLPPGREPKTTSNLPSPSISPIARYNCKQTRKINIGGKGDVPQRAEIAQHDMARIAAAVDLAVTTSALPSPSKSASHDVLWVGPVVKLTAGAKELVVMLPVVPMFRNTEMVPSL